MIEVKKICVIVLSFASYCNMIHLQDEEQSFFAGETHLNIHQGLQLHFFYRTDRTKMLLRWSRNSWRRCSRLCIFQ